MSRTVGRVYRLGSNELRRHLIQRLVVLGAVRCALPVAAVRRRDKAKNTSANGAEAKAAHKLREADLYAAVTGRVKSRRVATWKTGSVSTTSTL